MPLIDEFDDSLDEDSLMQDPEPKHPLSALNSRILACGYEGILEEGELNETSVQKVIQSLLDREKKYLNRIGDINEEFRKGQIELKVSYQKIQTQKSEIEKQDRQLNEARSRELKNIKRVDSLEYKLREKTDLWKKLTIQLKNQDSKFRIDKRKLETENGRNKEKLSELSKGISGKQKAAKMDCVINLKIPKIPSALISGSSSSIAIDNVERQLARTVDENSKLRTSLFNAQDQIYQTLENFPNFQTDIPQNVPLDGDIHKLELSIAKNCDKFKILLGTLNHHNANQIEEITKDYHAKCEKDMITKVAVLESKLDQVKAELDEEKSEEKLFEQMAKMVQQDIGDINDFSDHSLLSPEPKSSEVEQDLTPDHVSSLFSKGQARRSTGLRAHLAEVQLNSPESMLQRSLFHGGIDDDSLELE